MSLKKQFITGVLWNGSANLIALIVNFTLGVWLARILGPNAYGLIAMVMIIVGFSQLLMNFGFSEILIQRKDVSEIEFSTIFWFNLCVSLILFFLLYKFSPFVAAFYDEPSLEELTRSLSFLFLLNSLALIQKIKLEKALDFKILSLVEIASNIISISISLWLALRGSGVWALVFLHISKRALFVALLWLSSKWIPKFVFNYSFIKRIFRFSLALFLNSFFEFVASNVDKLLLGKYLGGASLGLYNKGLTISRMPSMQLTSTINKVIFPTFSKIQDNRGKIISIYKQTVLLITVIVFPIMLSFFLFADTIILMLFGPKWIGMIPVFKIFSLTAGFIPFNILIDNVIKSLGDYKRLNYITFVEKPLTIIGIVMGLILGGLVNVVYCLTIAVFIVFIVKNYFMSLSLGINFLYIIKLHFRVFLLVIFAPMLFFIIYKLVISIDSILLEILVLSIGFVSGVYANRKEVFMPILNLLSVNNKI